MRSKRTPSTSPGMALCMKNGPVCGLPPRTCVTPFSSAPPASTVVVCTVSPGQIVSTGLVRDENSRSKVVGVNSWRSWRASGTRRQAPRGPLQRFRRGVVLVGMDERARHGVAGHGAGVLVAAPVVLRDEMNPVAVDACLRASTVHRFRSACRRRTSRRAGRAPACRTRQPSGAMSRPPGTCPVRGRPPPRHRERTARA